MTRPCERCVQHHKECVEYIPEARTEACAGCRKQRVKCSLIKPCERCVGLGRECTGYVPAPDTTSEKPYTYAPKPDTKRNRTSDIDTAEHPPRRQRVHESVSSWHESDDIPFSMTTRSAVSKPFDISNPYVIAETNSPAEAHDRERTEHKTSMLHNPERDNSVVSLSISEFPDPGLLIRRTMPSGLSALKGKGPAAESPVPERVAEERQAPVVTRSPVAMPAPAVTSSPAISHLPATTQAPVMTQVSAAIPGLSTEIQLMTMRHTLQQALARESESNNQSFKKSIKLSVLENFIKTNNDIDPKDIYKQLGLEP